MNICRICKNKELLTLLDMGKQPIAHRFLNSACQDEDRYSVTLCFCEKCGHIQLIDPVPADLLYTNYVCLSSWKYQPHIPRLIELIEEKTNCNKDSNILEVGSNDGRFLKDLNARGYKKLIGIEPACDAQQAAGEAKVATIPTYFNVESAKKYAASYGKCDLFISRQMLEHINDLKEFSSAMQEVLSPGAFVIFEVPDFSLNLDFLDYTLWEEHVNYFTIETLQRFLENCGIQLIHNETFIFSGTALIALGKYNGRCLKSCDYPYLNKLREKVVKYSKHWPIFRESFIQYLRSSKKNGRKIASYGAGARSCSFINYLGLSAYIDFVLDDQPEKQGKFMPGSKLPILPGNTLEEQPVDLCLLGVNAECEDKVIAKHSDFVKRGGTFVSILPPSKYLPDFWKELNK